MSQTYDTPNRGFFDRAKVADQASSAAAQNVSYVTAASTDWPNIPTEVASALDELAARVKTLEGV